tara:strand:+ start:8063 stop:8368 length:306 start_codon:yes stop_codon:yes gene_type:complete
MINKKQLIEELLECVKDATDTETRITGLSICAALMNEVLDAALIIDSVIPMLPNIESTEFCDWMTDNGYTDEQHGTMQKGDERYCINNLFKHYTNVLTFGN